MITLGIDLGGTNLRAATVTEAGALGAVRKVKLTDRTPEAVFRVLGHLISEVLDAEGLSAEDVTAAGVAIAGQVQRATGVVAVGPNLGWRDVPVAEALGKLVPFPIVVLNDLSAAAWGERMVGAGEGHEDLLMVAVGTGVGSGILSSGRLVEGADGVAGEIGHVKVVPGGRLCGCGEHGCVEAYAGGYNLANRAQDLIDAGEDGNRLLELAGGKPITAEVLEKALPTGDPVANKVITEAGDYLGLVVANAVTLLNPGRLVLGGGVLLGFTAVREHLKQGVARLASRTAVRHLTIRMAALGDDAGLIGAGLLAQELHGHA